MSVPDHTYLMSKRQWHNHRLQETTAGRPDPGPWKKPQKKKDKLKTKK